jgi:hypothetical protein
MNVVIQIPDDIAERIRVSGDVERQALEALAAESYRAGHLTKPELCRMLGFEALDEFDGFLKSHGVFEPYTAVDLERERQDLRHLGL